MVVFLKKALLVSHSDKSAASLSELLRSEKYTQISVSNNATDAKILAEKEEYDLICLNAPLSDESGIDVSKYFASTTRACVVIIVPQKNADEINDVLTQYGVLVISKPINRHLFHHYLQFTECFKMRILSVARENEKLKHMVEDIKLIDRAKFLLITCLNMNETQAHRYLEKQAMDLRISKLQVAKQVIKTYEN
ncbi:MAG TPA: response regulator receiver protein [Ruminococcus sp.]|nr:response regulator receiver protein [Ruminococcus sp.]